MAETTPRVYFLIRSLERGGAERQLIELARGLANNGYQVTVATLYPGGAMRRELVGVRNLDLRSFGKASRWDPSFLLRLAQDVWSVRPDIIHGYMSPANEIATILGKISGAKSVIGLRASNMDLSRYDSFSRRLFRSGALASRHADAVVVNSHAGRAHHVASGYAGARMVVIPNGIDCERFRRDSAARRALRESWGLDDREFLFGLVGRLDPMKDHATYLRAIAMRPLDQARYVCVGGGSDSIRRSLQELARELGVADRVRWFGARDDVSAVYNALDALVLSSAFGEGFPNAVAEAMATELPCIVTDVGDAGLVVGPLGSVVPPRDERAMAEAMNTLVGQSIDELAASGVRARARVVENFSTERLVASTSALFDALVHGRDFVPLGGEASPPDFRRTTGAESN